MGDHRRTSIEWICSDGYEAGSFDFNNIMSPPDHESMFVSLINANPITDDVNIESSRFPSTQLGGATTVRGLREAAVPGATTGGAAAGPSLVSMVQKMDLTGGASALSHYSPEHPYNSDESLRSPPPPAAAPSVVPQPAAAEPSGATVAAANGLPRVGSAATQLDTLGRDESPALPAPRRGRRQSISCPNTPPAERRAQHSFFTESVFAEKASGILAAWQSRQAAPAAGGAAQLTHAVDAGQFSVDKVDAVAHAARKKAKPKPSRFRELNFMAPTSM